MSDHEKAFLVCENKCFVEGVTKEDYEENKTIVHEVIDSVSEEIEAYAELNKIKVFERSSGIAIKEPQNYSKYRFLYHNTASNSNTLEVYGSASCNNQFVKISWMKVSDGNTTVNNKIVLLNAGSYSNFVTVQAGERYYVEIENLSYVPAEATAQSEEPDEE